MDPGSERTLEIIMFGDGLSGKTTLLKAMAMEIALDEYRSVLMQRGIEKENILETRQVEREMLEDKDFLNQLQKENPSLHEYLFKDVSLGTLGIETINFKWRSEKRNPIHIKGYDLGGQNVYDHLRSILSGLATPKTRMIAVFDMSRRMSCVNSLKQIQNQLKHGKKTLFTKNTFIFVFNKKDLHLFLKSRKFQDAFQEEFLRVLKITQESGLELEIPSILHSDKIISVTVPKSPIIGFECLETIVYDVLRTHIIPRYQNIMTDTNARALAREISFHFLTECRADSSRVDHNKRPLEELEHFLFSERPLAVQHLGNLVLNSTKKRLDTKDLLNILRMKLEGFEIDARVVTSETIKKILNHVVNVDDIKDQVAKLGKNCIFETNALSRQGVKELLKYLLETVDLTMGQHPSKILHRLHG